MAGESTAEGLLGREDHLMLSVHKRERGDEVNVIIVIKKCY